MSKSKSSGGRLSGADGPGGGMGSKATHAPTTYFTGQPSQRINPKGVSQVGQSVGNHSMDSGGKRLTKSVEPVRTGAVGGPGSIKLGNECALDVGKGGPGADRVVYGSGSQQQHGGPAGRLAGQGRDILSEFGSESAGVRGRPNDGDQ
jgi:hypothetical protein